MEAVQKTKNPLGSITKEAIKELKLEPESLNVMDSVQATSLVNILKRNYKTDEKTIQIALIELAAYCHSNGSSPFLEPAGESKIPGCSLSDLVASIKESKCSLRQCNAFFANIIYDWSIENLVAPANWRSSGFHEDTKYAAFDFFHGVGHPNALVPEGGCKYTPPDKEIHAANISRQHKIIDANISKGNSILNIGEVTGGREGVRSKLLLRNEFQTEV
ncbi:capsid protein [Banana virus X]|uniref:Capsid protein n=1 Tax=Banana virus X TaxID=307671 RepID=Q5IJQ0_9VIRU|nr:capsid protein [Banana virus X]AAW50962.1 capsid protein [Banana virus X]